MKKRFLLGWAEAVASAIAVICLGSFLVVKIEARLFNFTEQVKLTAIDAASTALDRHAVPRSSLRRPPAPRPGDLLGWLKIPRVKISAAIIEGTAAKELRKAIGHVPGTAVPGQSGNIALAAHRDSFFHGLKRIRKGDEIDLLSFAGERAYRVSSIEIVPPTTVSVLREEDRSVLTLLTCYPFNWIGSAPSRLVVRALPIDPPRSRVRRR
ncbi:MAG TPA: class D sortase, partial [Thermoanaerobaculia bacterium]|nr:class D sortase [Thermoanaerobaculia bacterium]